MSRALLALLVPLAGCVADARYEPQGTSYGTDRYDRRAELLDPADALEAFMAASSPGEPHARLATLAGRWDLTGRMRWAPAADWAPFSGTAEAKPILGGRFVALQAIVETSETYPSYQGFNLLGYDSVSGEWFHQYLTDYSTSPRLLFGREVDGEVVLEGEVPNAFLGGAPDPLRVVLRVGDPEQLLWREYFVDDDGEEFLAMEAEYTRPR